MNSLSQTASGVVTTEALKPLDTWEHDLLPGHLLTRIENIPDEILEALRGQPGLDKEALYWQILDFNEVFEEALDALEREGRVHAHLGLYYTTE